MWMQDRNLAEQIHCQTGEFPQEIIKGSLLVSTHTHLSLGSCHRLQELWQRVLSFDPLTRQLVWTCGAASSFLGLTNPILSYSNYAFGIHHIPPMCNLWPRWALKA